MLHDLDTLRQVFAEHAFEPLRPRQYTKPKDLSMKKPYLFHINAAILIAVHGPMVIIAVHVNEHKAAFELKSTRS